MQRLVKMLNALLMTLSFSTGWYLYYGKNTASPYYIMGNLLVITLFLIIYCVIGRIYDAFVIAVNRISETIYSQVLSVFITDTIMYILIWLLSKGLKNLVPMILVFVSQSCFAILWAYFSHIWYFKTYPASPTAIIYDDRSRQLEELINSYGLEKKFYVVKAITYEEYSENSDTALDGIETVFLCGIHSHDRNIVLKDCVKRDIATYILPKIGDIILSGAKQTTMFHLPILRSGRYSPSPEFLFIKRAFDIFASLLALIVLSPVFLIVSIFIKAEDKGPVFYKQTRLTKNGKEFRVYKFRSMRTDAEKDGVARLSTGENDSRITKTGKVIRMLRLDELPQFINILKGEMSFVGPRPERPEIAAEYEKALPEFSLRLQAKAGLTGYAQVYGKYNTTPYDKLQFDLVYLAKPSIFEDLKIIFATVKILFMPESTEGIAEGATTAANTYETVKK